MADVTQGLMQNLVQYLIIAGLLLWSCYVVLRRFMPKTSFKWQQAMALWLASKRFVRLSGWLMPKAAQSGCSAGCSDCSVDSSAANNSKTNSSKTACETEMPELNDVKEQPVQWR
ncbi:DUF6587 family protein [Alkanindiges illinoisensis]|uniref:Uncharacterized protein n=1 Tax=Alkanindiges illinoisensis TaxID=197183 RepID=A0A4Y7XDF9_9GAMM|nr:DUF6587 family protein [Alkanindiges illinoisensis]TEU28500.1 hypothetical protein E2B99_05775 [Alkanindiges illinoisensis]